MYRNGCTITTLYQPNRHRHHFFLCQ